MDDAKLFEILGDIKSGQAEIKAGIKSLELSVESLELDMKQLRMDVSAQQQESNYMQAQIKALYERMDERKADNKVALDDVYEYVNQEKERTEKKFEEMREYARRLTADRDRSCAILHTSLAGSLKIWVLTAVVGAGLSAFGFGLTLILKLRGIL